MRQRLLITVLIALLTSLDCWAALSVNDTFTAGGITYKVTSTSPMEVQVGTGEPKATAIANTTAGDFTIPSAVRGTDGNDYTVTSIAADAFFGCSSLTSVAIPRTKPSEVALSTSAQLLLQCISTTWRPGVAYRSLWKAAVVESLSAITLCTT